jgi:hypothetical protein
LRRRYLIVYLGPKNKGFRNLVSRDVEAARRDDRLRLVANPALVSTELRGKRGRAWRLDCRSNGSSSLIARSESVGTNQSLRSLDSLR